MQPPVPPARSGTGEFLVSGTITLADGKPAVGYRVRARDRDLRRFQSLGREAVTDADGRYRIGYSREEFCRAEKNTADLVIRVFAPDGAADPDRHLAESDIYFNAPAVAQVDVSLPHPGRALSEYERYLEVVAAVICGQDADGRDVPLGALTEEDIDFTAGDTGIDRQHVRWLHVAAKLAGKTSRHERSSSHDRCEDGPGVPPALFYGWFREGVSDEWEQLIEVSMQRLRAAAHAAIEHLIIPKELAKSLEKSLAALPNARRDEVVDAASAVGLGPQVLDKLLEATPSVTESSNLFVSRLVADRAISADDAHRFGLGLAVQGLAGGNADHAAALLSAKPARLKGRPLQRARDLAALEAPEIEKALSAANVPPPKSTTLPAYAALLATQIAESFPADAMLHRATRMTSAVSDAIARHVRNPAEAAKNPEVRAFINLHPGLALGQALEGVDAAQAIARMKERLAWVEHVHEINADLDLLSIDYSPQSESLAKVKLDGLTDDARSMVIANLKAYQRVNGVGGGAQGSLDLLKAGYASATALSRSMPEEIAERSGLPLAQAQVLRANAMRKANDAALSWFALHDLERDSRLIKHRSLPQPPSYLKQLVGYSDLFGSVNFCHCEKCRSVLGAGAYFVDLMYYLETHVLKPSFTNVGGERHSLHPRSRRPDLWDRLQITCENTNTVVPTLDLVIEMLETFIVREKQLASADQLYQRLATVDHTIRLPFSLPLGRLSVLLSHIRLDRAEISRVVLLRDQDAAARARIRLGLLLRQAQIISTSRLGDLSAQAITAAERFFSQWLNANVILSTIPGQTETRAIDPLNVLSFTRASRFDRATTIALLTTAFVNGSTPGAPAPVILEAAVSAGGVQNDYELVKNLSAARLDRFERLARLWPHVPWTVAELDYVIGRLRGQSPLPAANALDEELLIGLARLLDLQDRVQLPVDELCTLWDSPPAATLRGEGPALFDRVFNMAPFVRDMPRWPSSAGSIDASASIRARLVAALQISDADVAVLMRQLDPCFGRFDVNPQGVRTFTAGKTATERNLSLLYRHARVSRLLKLSIEDLFQTLGWTPAIAARAANERCISTLADLGAVLDTHGWRVASGFSIAETRYLLDASATLEGYDGPSTLASAIAAQVLAERPLYLSADVFTQIGLTPAQSEKVVVANSQGATPLFEQVPGEDVYRIRRSIAAADVPVQLVFDETPGAAMIAEIARNIFGIVKLAGDAGFAASDMQAIGLSAAQAVTWMAANVSANVTDTRPFEAVAAIAGVPPRYRLRSTVAAADALANFGGRAADVVAVKLILRVRAQDLVVRHHAESVLATKASTAARVSPEKARALLRLVSPRTTAQLEALADSLQGGPTASLAAVLSRLLRHALLLRAPVFDPAALDFLNSNRDVLSLTDVSTLETLRRVSAYASLATAPDAAYEANAAASDSRSLHDVLTWNTSIRNANTDAQWAAIAGALRSTADELRRMLPQIEMPTGAGAAPRIRELQQLKTALDLARRAGAPAELLKLAVSDDHAELARAASGIFAAVRAKYMDEKVFREKLEPFEDSLRSRNRDGLVEYLMSAPDTGTDWRRRFLNVDDLYHHFLTDVQVEGSARTSRLVAAISSLQLYVHRVLMNLEQSDENPPTLVARFDDDDAAREWAWRKNFQVWVANRKVFLFPENYIEPGLRDDKTPLFRELEDTLLQQQVTEQNVLDAYSQYLHGFEQVAGLQVAGAYHDRQATGGDRLHLFGVTASEPPVHYYRSIEHLESGSGPLFSAWKKVELQIPVRQVSPIVHLGRLYVFWVETVTRPHMSEFRSGGSTFLGYRHATRLRYSLLRADGRWSAPQALKWIDGSGAAADTLPVGEYLTNVGPPGSTSIADVVLSPPYDIHRRDHKEPIDAYVPEGWRWRQIYPSRSGTAANEGPLRFAFEPRRYSSSGDEIDLWSGSTRIIPFAAGTTLSAVYAAADAGNGRAHVDLTVQDLRSDLPYFAASAALGGVLPDTRGLLSSLPVVSMPGVGTRQIVNGNEQSLILEYAGDSFLLEASFTYAQTDWVSTRGTTSPTFNLWRLGTTIAPAIGQRLATTGLDGMLDTGFQMHLQEAASEITPLFVPVTSRFNDKPTENGAGVAYYREIFFHIPFLIADHLNSQQKFADAQRWYHYLFDPTASDPGVEARVRPWRYREFRETGIQTLRAMLTNEDALAAYRRDPFNPHAIARLRPGAYQKSIVMKYIDNLLDWADSLFMRFTMESINEASLLYVMAADILGPRPVELGSCGETIATPRTYAEIAPILRSAGDKADFLLEELETITLVTLDPPPPNFIYRIAPPPQSVTRMAMRAAAPGMPPAGGEPVGYESANPYGWNRTGAPVWKDVAGTSLRQLQTTGRIEGGVTDTVGGFAQTGLRVSADPAGPPGSGPVGPIFETPPGPRGTGLHPKGFDRDSYLQDIRYGERDIPIKQRPPHKTPGFQPAELVHARLVFCFPENAELRAYWDRVEDRLFKIRNCMDIAGVRRRLELFAPEIDPRMLIRMRAAGLSLDDVLNVTRGNLPPYRFTYLIEKARQHAGLVQNFGGQVLTALEKQDTEELARLRTVHEQNLLKLRTQMTRLEIDAADDTLESLRRQKASAEYRREHYAHLLNDGLNPWERTQQVSTHAGNAALEGASVLQLLGGGLRILPQLGAPTAMKYGGAELGQAAVYGAGVLKMLADLAELAGKSAGLEAGFQRRGEDWKHQIELAKKEADFLDKQIAAAQIRRDIAAEALAVHERSIEQVQEVFDFLRDRFTNFGRFTWLSGELQKLHRAAFNAALTMARLAEQACQFEHPDDVTPPALSGDYWDAGNSGLLAGDRLLLDLHELERRYIETNHRTLEIEQSFSLARFAPDALNKLRTDCSCTFTIPEWFFDLTYPGHYRRRIRAVRLTLPCVAGPHANIGATLQLLESSIRKEPTLESSVPVPLRHTTSIATSQGQGDAGVFDFSFRDERYMPFEGAGASSTWELTLPKAVKPFDYATISDVILRISYTAESNADLREATEDATDGVLATLSDTGIVQGWSLRGEFPDAWHMLAAGATEVSIEIRHAHLPFFMSEFELQPAPLEVLMAKLAGNATYPTFSVDGHAMSQPTADDTSGLRPVGRGPDGVAVVARHVIRVTGLGSATFNSGANATPIEDLVLRVALMRRKSPDS